MEVAFEYILGHSFHKLSTGLAIAALIACHINAFGFIYIRKLLMNISVTPLLLISVKYLILELLAVKVVNPTIIKGVKEGRDKLIEAGIYAIMQQP
ncbi:hypothetical protein H8S90_05780 [Olivibacter sp. SDN3]|uniref:hypothetical protein n=1 Tax=Olivibacter sp. SDN3 TaxID=2764720 RepID=UPI0016514831|nr:hypothetical protein [Olivibacter sp. SDN3]QNL51093.1 hypothetical protein H8S90_05780 [Olivibacter sp. SDN3]